MLKLGHQNTDNNFSNTAGVTRQVIEISFNVIASKAVGLGRP